MLLQPVIWLVGRSLENTPFYSGRVRKCLKTSCWERLRRMDHKLDGLIEDMRGIRLDVQEIKTRIALIERGYAPNSQSFDRLPTRVR
jgi:hypothetical protein